MQNHTSDEQDIAAKFLLENIGTDCPRTMTAGLYRTTDGTLYFARHVRTVSRCFNPRQIAGVEPPTPCPSYIIRRAVIVTDEKTVKQTVAAYRKPFKGWKKRTRVAWTRAYRARVAEMPY